MNRYRVAQALGEDRFKEVFAEDEELLRLYGLKLMHVQCGVTAAVIKDLRGGKIHPWNVVEMNDKTWRWLRPLLVRLRDAEAQLDDKPAELKAAK